MSKPDVGSFFILSTSFTENNTASAKAIEVLENSMKTPDVTEENKRQALICLCIISHRDKRDDRAKNYIAQW
jgi:hypothetical protein